jgi:hypothetical protein
MIAVGRVAGISSLRDLEGLVSRVGRTLKAHAAEGGALGGDCPNTEGEACYMCTEEFRVHPLLSSNLPVLDPFYCGHLLCTEHGDARKDLGSCGVCRRGVPECGKAAAKRLVNRAVSRAARPENDPRMMEAVEAAMSAAGLEGASASAVGEGGPSRPSLAPGGAILTRVPIVVSVPDDLLPSIANQFATEFGGDSALYLQVLREAPWACAPDARAQMLYNTLARVGGLAGLASRQASE